MKFLRFDLKTERRKNLKEKKFCLAYLLWNLFLENFQKAYNPNVNIIIDGQLFSCTARCKFIQYMPNKPDKFGVKFWMTLDVESKYLYNGFPNYLVKDLTKSGDASLPTDVIMKLMIPLFRKGFHVTCDNYFTFLDLSLRLTKRQCSLVATIRANQRKIIDLLKKKHHGYTLHRGHYSDYHFLSVQTVEVCKHLSTTHKKLLFQSTIIRSVSLKPCSFTTRRRLV